MHANGKYCRYRYIGMMETPAIGFIGQGFIGKAYADDFERRGFSVVRYALEEPYNNNAPLLKECAIVLIAVPTPTTPTGFDYSIVKRVIEHVPPAGIAVIKSTLACGTTEDLQKAYPDRIVLHSPEFLREVTAAHDAAHPERNIIGIPNDTDSHRAAARKVLGILPKAPYELVCSAREAEYIKVCGNAFLYFKVLYANLMHDVATKEGCNWEIIRQALGADPRIGPSHLSVTHQSGHPGATPGRGAGGHCLIKDFAALRMQYEKVFPEDTAGAAVLRALECKNIDLLSGSNKDLDLLKGVYGDSRPCP